MKNLFIYLALALLTSACGGNGGNGTTTLKVTGSTTVGPLATKAAEEFEKQNEKLRISISEGGSGVGIANLIDGTTDIAMASRGMKESEKLKFKERSFKDVVLGFDALSVVVHPENPIQQLSKAEIKAIFTGEVSNWSEVGGPDLQIVPVVRESSSGTYVYFREEALGNQDVAQNAMAQGSNGGVVQTLSQTPGAIGYIGFAFEDPEKAKAVSVSWDGGNSYVAPKLENAMRGEYPLSRPLYFYYIVENEEKVKPYIDFILSDEGQAIVKEVGYIPAK